MELSKRTGVAMVATRCVMQLHGSVSFVVIVIVVFRLVVVSVVFKLVIVIIVIKLGFAYAARFFLPCLLSLFKLPVVCWSLQIMHLAVSCPA